MKGEHTFAETITIRGKGYPVVLLHGYLESKEIWDSFAHILEDQFQLIIPDLPGHGKSGILSSTQSMEILADYIHDILVQLGLTRVFMVGHSLGGYVTLAFADRYVHMLSGFCLFHSHPLPDTMETKDNRHREIALVSAGKKELIVNTNIPRAFALENVEVLTQEVKKAKEIARSTPDDGIVAMLKGMMARPDRSGLFFGLSLPVLWILGENDQYISFAQMKNTIPDSSRVMQATLSHSGHMGFLEEPERSAEILTGFINRLIMESP